MINGVFFFYIYIGLKTKISLSQTCMKKGMNNKLFIYNRVYLKYIEKSVN
jgi:hypothetical protein